MVRTLLGQIIPLEGKVNPESIIHEDNPTPIKIADKLWMWLYTMLQGTSDDEGRHIIQPSMVIEVKKDCLVAHLQGGLADWFVAAEALERMNTNTFRHNLTKAVQLACLEWGKKKYGRAFRASPAGVEEEE